MYGEKRALYNKNFDISTYLRPGYYHIYDIKNGLMLINTRFARKKSLIFLSESVILGSELAFKIEGDI